MAIAKNYPLPKYLRGENPNFFDAITELYEMIGALQDGTGESGMALTGVAPESLPSSNWGPLVITGTGFTDPWSDPYYILAFAPTGGSSTPVYTRTFVGGSTETELTTANFTPANVGPEGGYDVFLIKGDDQGDPIQPYVVLSNSLTVTIQGEPQ